MTEARRENNHDSDLEVHGLSLFECCCCHSSKHNPVELKCLHYYCRSCFDARTSMAHELRCIVTCPACSEVNEITTVLTNSFLSTYKRATGIRDEIVLCNTCEKNGNEETAEFWCVVCTEALCAACFVRHKKFSGGHRIFELEHARSLPLRQLTKTVQCNLHNRAMEAHCVTCCLPKCAKCLESCSAGSHDLHFLSDDVTREHISCVTKRASDTAQRLSSLLPGILQKCRSIASRLQTDRTKGHIMLVNHRRRLHDATLWAFDESASEVCCNLQSTRYEHPVVLAKDFPRSCAANIDSLALSAVPSVQLLVARHLLKMVATHCCLASRSSIRRLLLRREESGSISINGSVSLTCDIVLSAFLGATVRMQAAPRAPLLFHEASVSFETSVSCRDLAATRDGHVLLAAREHGLLVYSDSGQQLSSWRPAKQSDGRDDEVECVAAVSDQRAAVGVFWAQLVVLLKLSETGDSCQEDRRVTVLQSAPWRLAAHGDLLAATEGLVAEGWRWAHELKLLRLSSGQLLYTQSRDYWIERVALTALCVVTASSDPVERNSGSTSYVLEAFSHSGQFLWSYETSDEEDMTGLCVSADTWSRVYVAVRRGNRSRVMAICGTDGRDSREVMSSRTHGLQLGLCMSLARGQQRTVLAVLSGDGSSVSLYEATD